jgi:nucleoside-diphosphate-sugar epimerase
MPGRVPDISKIQRLTGYQPSVELDEILERVIADFRNSEEREFAAAEKTA